MDALPVLPHIGALVAAIIVGVRTARRLRRIDPEIDAENALRRLPHVWFATALVVAIGIGVFWLIRMPIGRQAELPLWILDTAPLALWGSILLLFGYLFSLTLTLAFDTKHETRWALLLGAVLAITAVEVAHASATKPIWPELEDRRDLDGAILQSSGATCAAASGANIAGQFGVELDEATVAREMNSGALGTSTGQIVRGMRGLGFDCQPFAIEPDDFDSIEAPAFAFVRLADGSPDGHAIAILDIHPDSIEFVDPLAGTLESSREDFVERWGGRGASCEPQR